MLRECAQLYLHATYIIYMYSIGAANRIGPRNTQTHTHSKHTHSHSHSERERRIGKPTVRDNTVDVHRAWRRNLPYVVIWLNWSTHHRRTHKPFEFAYIFVRKLGGNCFVILERKLVKPIKCISIPSANKTLSAQFCVELTDFDSRSWHARARANPIKEQAKQQHIQTLLRRLSLNEVIDGDSDATVWCWWLYWITDELVDFLRVFHHLPLIGALCLRLAARRVCVCSKTY